MKKHPLRNLIVATCLLADVLPRSGAASDSSPIPKASEGKGLLAAPKGLAPLAGVAVVLPNDATDSRKYAWTLRLSVPKVVWDIVGKERPKVESTKVTADVEVLTLDLDMGYSKASQLSEYGQNRVVDLKGKRLSRQDALGRLASNTPVLVSVSGEMPDPFYLHFVKPETLVVLLGLPSAREYNLLPTSKAANRQAEPSTKALTPPNR